MLAKIGALVVRRARTVLTLSLVVLLGAGILGVGAFSKLQTDGAFQNPPPDSTAAQHVLDQRYGGADNVVLLVHARHGTVDSPAVSAVGASAARRLAAEPGVANVISYWQTGSPQLRSPDRRYALVMGSQRTGHELDSGVLSSLASTGPDASVTVGGGAAVNSDVTAEVGKSLIIAEAIAVPIILILLVFAFGSVVAALLPLAIGAVAIMGTFAELFVLGSVTDVAVYAINLTTALGLSLAIDYALLMTSRYREHLVAGSEPGPAVVHAVATAGRTIVFSGATVVAALAVLLIFPLYFLRSFAYAGIGVVLISVVAAIAALPALLTVLGDRVNSGRLPWAKRRPPATAAPLAGRLAGLVMRRPLLTAVPVVAILLLLASPLLHVSFGTPDDRVLRPDTSSRAVGDVLRAEFPGNSATAIDVVTEAAVPATGVRDYAATLSTLPDVSQVQTSLGAFTHGHAVSNSPNPRLERFDSQRLSVLTTADPRSGSAQDLVRDIRSHQGPSGVGIHVGGQTAQLVDSKHAIGSRLPVAAALIVLTTFLVLFLFTGSLLQPLRSLALNLLTLSATAGLMVWIFQDGHGAGLLRFAPLPLDTSMLMLLFCIAFGLSMDYEVIVLSRIKELHDQGADNHTAVTEGLTHSGRIVTTAAALVAVSFLAFGTSTVSFLQLFGIGAGFAVLIDATVVRTVLVPACQRALGRAAWYAPAPLRRLHARVALAETDAMTMSSKAPSQLPAEVTGATR
jgi:putative drug exporter of the RND superfamily